ncbi:polysaccharide biosynthesis C-terminal domain-containing protein [Mediterraneibacter sp. NSJ-55]|uniref:Polysaccharide biosynthesis C-terminal domain-containing protein n=1 Tax=Mediterraneibacter hominis TaxID=2763054 RepID=A0A923LL86_9FIRM|nr:polysaccharide biosynthesis C-terminal domain-containing protein [Mediterraneibacter hominis]
MKIRKNFFRCVIPSMLAFALSGVYAIADGFFVGNALGDNALAALNMAFPLTAFLQAVGTGIGMGGAILYSICMGSSNTEESRQYFGMSSLALVILGLLLTILFLIVAPAVLCIFGAAGKIQVLGEEYLKYIAFGALFQVLGTGLVPFIRNMGSSILAMAAMSIGFITNIFLDYLFVWVLPWGMVGAAVATDIGQAMTFFVCLVFFFAKKKRPSLHFRKNALYIFLRICKVGLSPFGLAYSPNITLILVNKSAAIFGGAVAVTCYAPISYISAVAMLLLQGVSDGSQPLLSLSYGRKELSQVKILRGLAYRFAFIVSVICVIFLFFMRGHVASLFGASTQITEKVASILPIFITGYIFVSISKVTTAYFYATGQNLPAYILIYGEPLFLLALLLCLPPLFSITGTWAAVPLSQILAMLISVTFLMREKYVGKL